MDKNIGKVLTEKMCSGCGACYSACPNNAIRFIEGKNVNYPKINYDKCIECGLCLKVCPGESNSQRFLDNEKINFEEGIKKIIVCHSRNDEIRNKSASGGFITQLIKYLFDNKEIDGAVIVKQSDINVLLNEVKVIDAMDDFTQGQGSRYSPSSNCIALREIMKSNKYNNVLFIGKPCDIEALSNFEKVNKKLASKIKLKLAIMCHHTPTRAGLRKLISAKKLNVDNVKSISFRGDGWPGLFKVIKKDGTVFKTSYFDAWNNYLCKDNNEKCKYCENTFPLEADFIVGDPWGEEFKDDTKGNSLVVVRSEYGEDIVNGLSVNSIDICKNVKYSELQNYQGYLLSRHNDFYVNALVYRYVHGYENKISDYINITRESPKNLLKVIKRKHTYKKSFKKWKYE